MRNQHLRWYGVIKVKLFQGHILEVLEQIPDNSVDCIITSPPYWGLREYPDPANIIWDGDPNCEHEFKSYEIKQYSGRIEQINSKNSMYSHHKNIPPKIVKIGGFCSKCDAWQGQLGLEPSLNLYISHLLQITAELKRVLKPTGVMFWNHGDSYAGPIGKYKGWSYVSNNNLPKKSETLQNFRLVLRMIDEQGWILRNVIVWYKPNHLPESVKDRFTKSYEPIFMLVKNKRYYFNLDAVKEHLKTFTEQKSALAGSFNYRVREAKKGYFGKIGVRASEEELKKYDNQGKLIENLFRFWGANKDGNCEYKKTKEVLLGQTPAEIKKNILKSFKNRLTKHDIAVGRIGNFSYNDSLHEIPYNILGKNPGDVWIINTEPFEGSHFAVFPTSLVRRCIRAGCPENGIVLDPFVGSGTTIKVAIEERKNCIGIDIVPKYIKMAEERCNLVGLQKLGAIEYEKRVVGKTS
jgi:site-specific DNA-methyltransferase (cytosine-N4-specific)